MLAIPIPKECQKQINSLIFNFIWSNKSEKIKRNTLIGEKLDGGLEIPDIEIYSKTLKLKWLKFLVSNEDANWKVIPKFFLNQYGQDLFILKMNLDSLKSLPPVKHEIPIFYKDLINHFIEVNNPCKNPKSFYEIRKQVIWGNCFIKFKGKCLVYHSWLKSGIIFINDIIDANGEIKATIIDRIQNRTNWISEFSKLQKAIPNSWKITLRSEASVKTIVRTNTSVFGNNISIINSNNREIKKHFVVKKFELPLMHSFWETKFNLKINWASVYFIINKVYVDNRIKELKLKIIHRIVPTNENLFKWKLIETPYCKHCEKIETLEHFFIKCNYLHEFMEKVYVLFKQIGICKRIDLFNIVIGYKTQFKAYNDINIIFGYITYTIYKCYMKSERRRKNINMLKILFNDLLTLESFYKKNKLDHPVIFKFNNALRDII